MDHTISFCFMPTRYNGSNKTNTIKMMVHVYMFPMQCFSELLRLNKTNTIKIFFFKLIFYCKVLRDYNYKILKHNKVLRDSTPKLTVR